MLDRFHSTELECNVDIDSINDGVCMCCILDRASNQSYLVNIWSLCSITRMKRYSQPNVSSVKKTVGPWGKCETIRVSTRTISWGCARPD